MSELLGKYQEYLEQEKHASSNTLASYLRDLRQFEQYLAEHAMQFNKVKQSTVTLFCIFSVTSISVIVITGITVIIFRVVTTRFIV